MNNSKDTIKKILIIKLKKCIINLIMSAFDSSEEDGYCGSCNILLDHFRDGTTENGHRCNNCYWEEEEGPSKIISPDYTTQNLELRILKILFKSCTVKYYF